jgi:hypothetical protein
LGSQWATNDQWFISRIAEYVRPFMAAFTAEALILWHEKTQDPKVFRS